MMRRQQAGLFGGGLILLGLSVFRSQSESAVTELSSMLSPFVACELMQATIGEAADG